MVEAAVHRGGKVRSNRYSANDGPRPAPHTRKQYWHPGNGRYPAKPPLRSERLGVAREQAHEDDPRHLRSRSTGDLERLCPPLKEIKAYHEVSHPLYSVWLLRTNWSTAQVRDDLAAHIDRTGKLRVWDVTGRAASREGLTQPDSAWIRATP